MGHLRVGSPGSEVTQLEIVPEFDRFHHHVEQILLCCSEVVELSCDLYRLLLQFTLIN